MSHFVTLVVGNDPETQLAGYDENGCHVFTDEEDAYLEEFNKDVIPIVIFADGRRYSKYDKEVKKYWRRKEQFGTSSSDEFIVPENAELKDIPAKEYYESFEEYMADWHGMKKRDATHGRYGSYCNPNAKWDYYGVGGRFNGWLVVKDGVNESLIIEKGTDKGRANIALFKHIDFDKTAVPFAVLKNGEWHELGQMGWWGAVGNEKNPYDWASEYKNLLEVVSENTQISIYDRHI
jgi:hypothetical protein